MAFFTAKDTTVTKAARSAGSIGGREFILSICDHYVASIKFHLHVMVSHSCQGDKRAMRVRRERNPMVEAAKPGS